MEVSVGIHDFKDGIYIYPSKLYGYLMVEDD